MLSESATVWPEGVFHVSFPSSSALHCVFAAQNTVRCTCCVCGTQHLMGTSSPSSAWLRPQAEQKWKKKASPLVSACRSGWCSRRNSINSTSQEFLFGALMFHTWRKKAASIVFNTVVPVLLHVMTCCYQITALSVSPLSPCLSGL